MSKEYNDLIRLVSLKKGERNSYRKQLKALKVKNTELMKRLTGIEKCVYILKLVIASRQNSMISLFESTVTSGLQDLFGEEYDFKIKFGTRNNVSKADFQVHTGEYKGYLPLEMCQGEALQEFIGAVMQIIFVSMSEGDKVVCLDEAFTGFEADKQWQLSQLLNRIADEFKIQLIIVSHIGSLMEGSQTKIELE